MCVWRGECGERGVCQWIVKGGSDVKRVREMCMYICVCACVCVRDRESGVWEGVVVWEKEEKERVPIKHVFNYVKFHC